MSRTRASLGITLVRRSPLPVYSQIKHYIKHSVAASRLPPGTRLPSVRELAAELDVARNTVARAYRELQDDGIIEVAEGLGTYVADVTTDRAGVELLSTRLTELTEDARGLVARARAHGFTSEDVYSAVERALASVPSAVVFVGSSERLVEKYRAVLTDELQGLDVEVRGVTLDALRASPQQRSAVLDGAFTAITLVSTYGDVARLTRPIGLPVVALLIEPTPETTEALSRLPASGRVVLVAEDIFLNSLLSLIATYCAVDRVEILDREQLLEQPDRLNGAVAVLYSFGMADLVPSLLPPDVPGIELGYVPSPEHLRSLRTSVAQRLAAAPPAARAGARRIA